jgi:methyl-accepting chemotaxis protein
MQSKTYKRRNYFVKHDMQGKYIFCYFLIVVGGILIFSILLGLFSSDTMTITYENYILHVGSTPLMLIKRFLAANWLFLIMSGVFMVLVTMFLSHRIAGPLFKFEKYIDSMLAGHFGQPLFLRSKDEGRELAGKIAELSRSLAETVTELDTLSKKIREETENSQSCRACGQIAKTNEKIQFLLKRFSVDG